jgi:hypothetical protein
MGMGQGMAIKRLHFTHKKTFEERLAEESRRFKEAADQLPPGTTRELLLRRARQAETAALINEWLTSRTTTAHRGTDEPAFRREKVAWPLWMRRSLRRSVTSTVVGALLNASG